MITADLLLAIMPRAQLRASLAAPALESARVKWGIGWGDETAHWLAQLAHESGQLRYTRELASGEAYEGRRDLGNTQPGDGKRFRGRGYIQLTGRSNYAEYATDSGSDVVSYPERLEDPAGAADVAGWFWAKRRIWSRTSTAADRVLAITKIINGGTNGLDDRRRFYAAAASVVVNAPPVAEPQAPLPPTPEPQIPDSQLTGNEPVSMPSGESPDYGAPPMPIPAILAAVLPSIITAIPELAKQFGSGSEVAERNVKAATKALEVVQVAVGAVNAQEAAEKIAADPQAREQARQAVQAQWFEIVEAGGGGIDGARKADTARTEAGWVPWKSASFMIAVLLFPLLYAIGASILFPSVGGDWPADVRAAITSGMVSSILGGLVGYYFGSMTGKAKA